MVEITVKEPGTALPMVNICTYNIIAAEGTYSNGTNRLERALRCMRLMNIDLGIFTETKLVQGYHTTSAEGYDIITTEAKSKHQGGVALFYRKSDKFHVEGTKTYGPNVMATTLVSGRRRWRIVGAYIPPSEVDGSTLDHIQTAAATAMTASRNTPLIMLGDLNVDLKRVDLIANDRQNKTAALVSSLGLKNLNENFVQRKGVRRCARYITGLHIRPNQDGTWTHPSSVEVLEKAGLLTIQEYIRCRSDEICTIQIYLSTMCGIHTLS